jgi:anti-sigma regulatory factor (Ser/Thr protein kinase)
LIDLGTALRLKKDGTAWVKELTGTPIYMAPETFSNIYSAKTDLYALGCVLFKLLTAHYPFKGRNMAIIGAKMKKDPPYAKDINSAVPAPLADFVYKLMERNPENRYKSAREAIKALEEIEIGFKKPEPGGRPAEADDLASRTKVWSIQSHGPEGQEAALKPAADVSAYVNKGEVNVPMAKIGVGRLKDGERMSTVGLQDCAGFIARGKKKDGSFVHVLGHLTPGNITGQIRAVASLLEKESLEAVEIYFNGSEYMRDSLIACLRGIRRILSAKLIVDFRKNIWREDIIQGRLSVPGSVGLDTRGFVSKETDIDGNEKDTARRWHLDKETLLEFEEESILELSAGVGLIPEINEKAWNHYRMTVIPAFSDEVVETSGGDKVLKCAVEAQEAAEKFVREKCPEADIPAWQIGDYVYEMCYNVKKHGGGGIVTLRRLYSGVKFTGFEVVARDLGAGIGEISEKLRQAVSVEKTDPRHGHGLRSLNESIFAGEGEITCETAGRVDKYNPDKKDFEKKKGAKTTVNKGTRISAKRKLYRAPYADEWGDLTPQFKEDAVRAIDTKLEDEKLIGKLVDAMIEFARSTAKKDPDAKALLAIDSDLGDENINRLYSELAKVLVELPDRNEELALFLENLEIITGKGKKLADRVRSISTESEKGNIKPENIVVVTTSGMANLYNDFNEEPTIAEIDNTDFPDEAYLPLLEIMLFTIARHLQWDQSELERYYKMIPNVTLMEDLERYDQEVLFVSKKAKRFIIRLIPDAVPFSGEIEVLRQNMLAALKRA